MGRRAKSTVSGEGANIGSSQSVKENIQWAGSLDTLLAYQMKAEWDRWRPGSKVICGRRWAKAIGIEVLDKDGTKTKAHVEQLIGRWKSAVKMMGTGFGDQSKRMKKNGEWVSTYDCILNVINLV